MVVGIVAAYFGSRAEDPDYQAEATLLVDSAVLRVDEGSPAADVLFAALANEVMSAEVLDVAASQTESQTAADLRSAVSVSSNSQSSTIRLLAVSEFPEPPVEAANAVALAFVEVKSAEVTEGREQQLSELDSQLAELEVALETLGRELAAAEVLQSDTAGLEAQQGAATVRYAAIFNQRQEIEDQIAQQDPAARLVFPAAGSAQPTSRSPIELGLIGAAIGALIGLGFAALREALDTRVRSRQQAEGETGWPVVVEIPKDRSVRRNSLVVRDRPDHRVAEAVRELRTSLQYKALDTPMRSLAVTSAQPGDGKSMIAANLACSFALAGIDTILVSADLRRPKVESMFGVDPKSPGLSDLLLAESHTAWTDRPAGWATPAERARTALQPTGVDRLRLLSVGSIDGNPGELLSSVQALEVFGHLKAMSGMVIVDSPPTAVADAAMIAGQVDGVLAVVSIGKTEHGALQKARSVLDSAPAPVLGIVLNRAKPNKGYSGYRSEQPVPSIQNRRASLLATDLENSGS